MKVLANDGLSNSGINELKSAGFDVTTDKVEQDSLIDYININNIEVILVRSATQVRKDIIDQCASLKIIGRGGVGMDNIDVDYARDKGLLVINTPAASSQSVAELVMAHLFNISRFVYDSNRNMPVDGHNSFKVLKKKYAKGKELRGKTLGVIGFGRIGQFTAKYALGNGMKILAYDPFIPEANLSIEIGDKIVDITIKTTNLNDLLKQADYISLHVPMPENKKPVITKSEFDIMKDGVMIVNAARGGVIDEDDLINAINNGKVAAAALDVFVGEPSPRADVLALANTSLTPHIGAATSEAQDRIGTELADKIKDFYQK